MVHTRLDAILGSYEVLDHLKSRLPIGGLGRCHHACGVQGSSKFNNEALSMEPLLESIELRSGRAARNVPLTLVGFQAVEGSPSSAGSEAPCAAVQVQQSCGGNGTCPSRGCSCGLMRHKGCLSCPHRCSAAQGCLHSETLWQISWPLCQPLVERSVWPHWSPIPSAQKARA